MCQTFRLNASLWRELLAIDRDLAERTRALGCGCGGPLHAAPYARKPRFEGDLGDDFTTRFSFCCGVEGCRKRATPPSSRFLGRRVFVGVVVVLVGALRQGPTPTRVRTLREHFGVSRRTIERWHAWWRERFPATRCWREIRGRVPRTWDGAPPRSLLDGLDAWEALDQQSLLMRLVSPLAASDRVSISLTDGGLRARRR
ncbi:MAG: hypothetical protein ACE5EF_07900 [Dehalococcoidia bacterium]